ncbi:MAG: aminodeoxychorismate/anthranilate synthase component II [Azospirillaceae bacterium]
MLLLIDNYDSFTYNLVHFFGDVGAACRVVRNDQLTADQAIASAPQGIVLSPGPCDPDRAGICLELVEKAAGRIPILGVCLGHQVIGQAFGGRVVRAATLMHGKTSDIRHRGDGVLAGLPDPLTVTRYHSLVVAPETLPDALQVTAETEDGVIMGLQHRQWPVFGVQFHPESIASQSGHDLLRNFVGITTRAEAA